MQRKGVQVMKVRNIISSILIAGTTLTGVSCKNNNKIVQPLEKQAKTVVKDTLPKAYADLKIYCGFEPKYNLRVENGVSFVTDNIKYSAQNGKIFGEFTDIAKGFENEKFNVEQRDYSQPAVETIKMLARLAKENASDTLTLSKADIVSAKSRLKFGTIWNDAKEFFEKADLSYLRFGKVKNTKETNGITIDIYDRDYKLSDIQFNMEK